MENPEKPWKFMEKPDLWIANMQWKPGKMEIYGKTLGKMENLGKNGKWWV